MQEYLICGFMISWNYRNIMVFDRVKIDVEVIGEMVVRPVAIWCTCIP